jgi:virginiamycin A acetyltransferase
MIAIAETARVSPLADIEDSVRGSRIVIEAGAVIDSFVKIKPAGGIGDIIIGPNSIINSGCVLYTGHGIQIGSNVLVAANCTFAPTNHEFRDPNRLIREQGFMPSRGGIMVEDDVWIGAGVILLDGAILRRGSIVGAGSVVRSELGSYTINAGIPARQVGRRA